MSHVRDGVPGGSYVVCICRPQKILTIAMGKIANRVFSIILLTNVEHLEVNL